MNLQSCANVQTYMKMSGMNGRAWDKGRDREEERRDEDEKDVRDEDEDGTRKMRRV